MNVPGQVEAYRMALWYRSHEPPNNTLQSELYCHRTSLVRTHWTSLEVIQRSWSHQHGPVEHSWTLSFSLLHDGGECGRKELLLPRLRRLNSQFHCYTVHGINLTRMSRNVAFNANGMCYYIEDGVKENKIFEYNLYMPYLSINLPMVTRTKTETFSAIYVKLLIPATHLRRDFASPMPWAASLATRLLVVALESRFPTTTRGPNNYQQHLPTTGLWTPPLSWNYLLRTLSLALSHFVTSPWYFYPGQWLQFRGKSIWIALRRSLTLLEYGEVHFAVISLCMKPWIYQDSGNKGL